MRQKIHGTLMRTSPKGEAFVGYCPRCGKQDLTPSQIQEDCDGTTALDFVGLAHAIKSKEGHN